MSFRLLSGGHFLDSHFSARFVKSMIEISSAYVPGVGLRQNPNSVKFLWYLPQLLNDVTPPRKGPAKFGISLTCNRQGIYVLQTVNWICALGRVCNQLSQRYSCINVSYAVFDELASFVATITDGFPGF